MTFVGFGEKVRPRDHAVSHWSLSSKPSSTLRFCGQQNYYEKSFNLCLSLNWRQDDFCLGSHVHFFPELIMTRALSETE